MRFFPRTTRPPTRRRSPRRAQRLRLEALENRCLLAAGDLDPSFDGDGLVVTDLSDYDSADDMVIQSDGKIVTAGAIHLSKRTPYYDFVLVRYNSNGSLDTSFNKTGFVATDFGKDLHDVANAVAVQSDGKIIAAGVTTISAKPFQWHNKAFALARYHADGSLDTSFGKRGKVVTDFGEHDERINDMVIQSDGKIVVAGFMHNYDGAGNFVVARYDTNGRLDPAFGNGGYVVTGFGSLSNGAHGVAIQGDGKIVITGDTASTGSAFGVARFNSDGTLDETFGSGGKVTTVIGDRESHPEDVAIQAGKIVAAGRYSYKVACPDGGDGLCTRGGLAVTRYLDDGALDPNFGTGGVVTETESTEAQSLTIQADAKIVVGGLGRLARLLKDGSLDATFGTSGVVQTSFGVNAVRIQADAKIVAAGRTGSDIAVARYLGDEPLVVAASTGSSFAVLTLAEPLPLESSPLGSAAGVVYAPGAPAVPPAPIVHAAAIVPAPAARPRGSLNKVGHPIFPGESIELLDDELLRLLAAPR